MTLFERVSELSKKQDKSLKVVAEELGLSRHAFYSWKTSSPKAESLEKVANYFDVTTDYLLGRTDMPSSDDKKNDSSEDNLTEFFKAETKGMTDEEIATLKKEWKDYLVIRKRMMRGE
ncbi:transcriptional regulator [Enterococcus pseudoavium]|nr:transcriptional regulator [Enterococcus pseudoavium]